MRFFFPLEPQSQSRRAEYPQLKEKFGKLYFRCSVLFTLLFPFFGFLFYKVISFAFSHFGLVKVMNAQLAQADLIVASGGFGLIISSFLLHIFLRKKLGTEYIDLNVYDNLQSDFDVTGARKWIRFGICLMASIILLRGLI